MKGLNILHESVALHAAAAWWNALESPRSGIALERAAVVPRAAVDGGLARWTAIDNSGRVSENARSAPECDISLAVAVAAGQ